MLDGDQAEPPLKGDAVHEWQTSDLMTTLPAELWLDAAAMLDLRGTLFPSVVPSSTKARNDSSSDTTCFPA